MEDVIIHGKKFIGEVLESIILEQIDKEGVLIQDIRVWLKNNETTKRIIKIYIQRENEIINKLIEKKQDFTVYMYKKYFSDY